MPARTPPLVSLSALTKRGLGRPSISVFLSWPAPNRIDPARKTWLIPYACLFLTLTTILLGARFWSRYKKQSGGFGLDDAIIFPAWIFGVINTALIIVAMQNGFGMHAWDVPFGKAPTAALMGWLSEGCFLITTCLTKISILLFYRRLSSGSYNRIWKLCTQIGIAFVVLYMVVFLLVLVFVCIPTDAFWRQYDLTYGSDFKCMDDQVPSVLAGTFSVVTDLYSVLLPCWLFWTLQMPRRQKMALWGVFAVGFLSVGCGIARTFYLDKMATTPNADVTWVAYDVMLWSVNEGNLAFICASLPALKPFFVRYFFPPASRAITSAKALSHKLGSVVTLPYPRHAFRSGSDSRGATSTNGSWTLASLGGKEHGRGKSIDKGRYGEFEGHIDREESTDEILLHKMGGDGTHSAEFRRPSTHTISSSETVKEREPGSLALHSALPSLLSRHVNVVEGTEGKEEVKVLLDVQERERMSFQCHGVIDVAVSQHSRQASNASDKPLPKLPVEL